MALQISLMLPNQQPFILKRDSHRCGSINLLSHEPQTSSTFVNKPYVTLDTKMDIITDADY